MEMDSAVRLRLASSGGLQPGEVFGMVLSELHLQAARKPFAIDLPEMKAGARPRLGLVLHVFGLSKLEFDSLLSPSLKGLGTTEEIRVVMPSAWACVERVQFPSGGRDHQRRLVARLAARRMRGLPTSSLEREIAGFVPGQPVEPFVPMRSHGSTGSFRLYFRRRLIADGRPASALASAPAQSYGLGRWIPAIQP